MGPLSLTLLAIAVVAAVMRAKFEQQARRHRTSEKQPGETRILPRTVGEIYTPEGERYLRLARNCRILLFLFGLGAIVATWKGF
jgi:hypothetical protein